MGGFANLSGYLDTNPGRITDYLKDGFNSLLAMESKAIPIGELPIPLEDEDS
jgi:hypothetical protein